MKISFRLHDDVIDDVTDWGYGDENYQLCDIGVWNSWRGTERFYYYHVNTDLLTTEQPNTIGSRFLKGLIDEAKGIYKSNKREELLSILL